MAHRAKPKPAADLPTFLANLTPAGAVVQGYRHTSVGEFTLSYITADGRHEIATWQAVSWQDVDASG